MRNDLVREVMQTREHVMSRIMPTQQEVFSKTPAQVIRHGINYSSFFEDFDLRLVREMTLSQLIHLKMLYAMADSLYQQKVIEKYCRRLHHNEGDDELDCPQPTYEWVNDITEEYTLILTYPKITDHFSTVRK